MLLCSHHRPYSWYSRAEHVLNVEGGAQLHADRLPMAGDDIGFQISALNPWLSELTTIWWAWKNGKLIADNIGFVHYRTWFAPFAVARRNPFIDCGTADLERFGVDSTRTAGMLCDLLTEYDAVMPAPWELNISLRAQFDTCYPRQHWPIVLELLNDRDAATWLHTMSQIVVGNMGVMRRELWDDYLNWLFPMVFGMHERFQYPAVYDVMHSRGPAAAAERLQTWWLHKHKLRVKYVPLLMAPK